MDILKCKGWVTHVCYGETFGLKSLGEIDIKLTNQPTFNGQKVEADDLETIKKINIFLQNKLLGVTLKG